jgi:surfactin synthase thioesterase subunit
MNKYYNRWFVVPKPKPNAQLTLFCFPYAGGSANIFMQWANALPDNVELVIIQAPGRGARMLESLYSDMSTLVTELTKQISPLLYKPYLFFGHSLGSRVAFELMNQIQKMGYPLPQQFIASGSRGPQDSCLKKPIYHLPNDKFIQELANLNGTPKIILENRELMELVLPLLRADFEMADTYCYKGNARFNCPITILGGKDDSITIEQLHNWGQFFTKEKQILMLTGDHFFIDSHKELVIKEVNKVIISTLKQLQPQSDLKLA